MMHRSLLYIIRSIMGKNGEDIFFHQIMLTHYRKIGALSSIIALKIY